MLGDTSSETTARPGEARQDSASSRSSGGFPQQGSSGEADVPQNQAGAEAFVSRAEFNKVVGQRQAAKEKARQLADEVQTLLDRLNSAPSDEEMEAFRDWRRLQDEAGPSPADPARDTDAIARQISQPLRQRIDELSGQKDALRRRLTDLLRDQELRVAAARANAINPEQVVALLRGRVRMTETDDGRFAPEFLDAEGNVLFDGPQRVADTQRFVESFLSMPDNANLVRSTFTPGSGARQAGGMATHSDTTPCTKAEFLSLPPAERLTAANQMTRQQRDAILGRNDAGGGGYL